jgi:hypothetical protein
MIIVVDIIDFDKMNANQKIGWLTASGCVLVKSTLGKSERYIVKNKNDIKIKKLKKKI